MIVKPLLAGLAISVSLTSAAIARDQIRIVGSSTVYPFATAVAEKFGKTTAYKTPVIESTGTGGGMKLFCTGTGADTPDFTNASRKIKDSEIELCASNGVTGIVEVKVGYDGIVMGNSVDADQMSLTRRDIFLALAKEIPNGEGQWIENPNKTWKDVNATLPDRKIEVLGPPPTSGTRDAFAELALEGGCKTFDWVAALKKQDKSLYKAKCHTVREDGAYIEAGENDNLIVQKLNANPDAFGVFGFSFLDQNSDMIQGSIVGDVAPEFEAISDGSYPISRSLFFYAKKQHIGEIPGMKRYLDEFTSEAAWGPEGYLADKGLIPMPDGERQAVQESVSNLNELGS